MGTRNAGRTDRLELRARTDCTRAEARPAVGKAQRHRKNPVGANNVRGAALQVEATERTTRSGADPHARQTSRDRTRLAAGSKTEWDGHFSGAQRKSARRPKSRQRCET
jgi:hypothetical protein